MAQRITNVGGQYRMIQARPTSMIERNADVLVAIVGGLG
jgi:hypothetical protein